MKKGQASVEYLLLAAAAVALIFIITGLALNLIDSGTKGTNCSFFTFNKNLGVPENGVFVSSPSTCEPLYTKPGQAMQLKFTLGKKVTKYSVQLKNFEGQVTNVATNSDPVQWPCDSPARTCVYPTTAPAAKGIYSIIVTATSANGIVTETQEKAIYVE